MKEGIHFGQNKSMITIEKNKNGYQVVVIDGASIPNQTIHGLTINNNKIIVEAYIDPTLNGSWTETKTKQASRKYWEREPDVYLLKEIKTIRLYLDKKYYEGGL